ncbi:MAG TPA: cyclase family protein [Acidimicrobiia bacterium]|nr:cyclase family protein [Acidimicrobiia bacterium]
MPDRLPSYDELPVQEGAPAGSSWGLWGDRDFFGTLNLLTPERVLAAARSIRTGRVFSLNPELTIPDPPLFWRARVRHEVTGELGGGHDDLYHNWNTQSSAQWDGFRHYAHRELGHYGGVPDEEHGIHYWAERGIVGRAVLADVARWREQAGRPIRHGEGDPIPADELAACLRDQGTTVETGDILLVRTGWLGWYRGLDTEGRAECVKERTLPAPGLSGIDAVRMLWDLHVAAVAADNPAVEVFPPPGGKYLHVHFLPLLGIPLGELWDLDDLADDCSAAGTYDAFFTSAPLNMPQGVASPPNAIAVR